MCFISITDRCLELGCWFYFVIFLLQGELKFPAQGVYLLKLNCVMEEGITNSFNTGVGQPSYVTIPIVYLPCNFLVK